MPSKDENLERALALAKVARSQMSEPDVIDTLGWVYVQKDQPLQAVPHLKEAVKAAPGNATFRYHLGVAFVSTGQFAEGRFAPGDGVEVEPESARGG